MKKVLSLVLALAMLLALASLASCGNDENSSATDPATTPVSEAPKSSAPAEDSGELTAEVLQASKPNEYVPEKIEAGMEVVIGFSLNNFEGVGKVVEARLLEEFPAMGLTLTTAVDGNDTALQISNIENFITMGCAAVLIHTPDVTLLEGVVSKAEEEGTSCILYGDIPQFYMSAYTSTDLAALGYSVGLLAREWITQTYPDAGDGSIKVAVHGSYLATPTVIMSDNVMQSISDDPRCVIVYSDFGVSGLDAGYTFAQQALTTDSEVKVFAGFNLQAAFGINNYIMSLPNVNPEEYCSVSATYDVSAVDFLAAAEKGEGVFRGTTAGSTDPAWGHLECIKAVLFNNVERPVVRMQEIQAFSNGLEVSDLMNQYYYGVYA